MAKWVTKGAAWVYIAVDRQIAEVVHDGASGWNWYRQTTIAEHGLPAYSGWEETRKEAMKRATAGINGVQVNGQNEAG